MSFILSSNWKFAGVIGIITVLMASIPATLLGIDSRSTSLMESLNQGIGKVKTLTTDSIDGMDTSLKNEYSQFGDQVKEGYKDAHTKNIEQLNSGLEKAEQAKELIKTHQEDINYYSFKFGHLAKEAVKNVPNIIKDSILESAFGSKDNQSLSLQKISEIVQSPKLKDFVEGVNTAMSQHQKLLSNFSSKDAQGIMQILRETPRNNIDQFLESVKTNAKKLDKDSSAYCNSTKLILHLMMGKDNVEGVPEKIKSLISQMDGIEDQLKTILNENISLESLKSQLNSLSSNSKIKDPCAS